MGSSVKTAVVTGACSGIGLAVTRHLLAQTDTTWHVVLADIREDSWHSIKQSLDGDRTLFVKTDVGRWEDNTRLFNIVYHGDKALVSTTDTADPIVVDGCPSFGNLSPRKIDFFFANAGVGDRDLTTAQFDLDAEPPKPDLSCLDVVLNSALYELRLFIHYTRKARRDVFSQEQQQQQQQDNADTFSSSFQPKFVITSSMTAQYPFPIAPQYGAGKAAVLSLTRSIGPPLLASDGITVNCVMPAYVATNVTPPGLNDAWPQHWVTPVATIARGVNELIDPHGHVVQDGRSDGPDGVVKSGQSVECVLDRLYYRRPVEYVDDSEKFLIDQAFRPEGLWSVYIDKAFEDRGQVGRRSIWTSGT